MMRALSVGRETTMTAMHISAVHQRSVAVLVVRILNTESCQTDDDCDETEGEDATKCDLLPLPELEAIDDEERKYEYYYEIR
jgi:hypothetical protein